MRESRFATGRRVWWSLVLLAASLGALALAGPATAGGGEQGVSISQDCSAGDSGSGDDSDGGSSGGGDCSNQRRVVQQRAGGDVSRSIDQSQSFGGDGEVRMGEDFEEEDFETEADASASDEEFECGDGRACEEEFTQSVTGAPEGGVETGGGGTLARASEAAPTGVQTVARIAGPALALALVGAGLLGLRRGRSV